MCHVCRGVAVAILSGKPAKNESLNPKTLVCVSCLIPKTLVCVMPAGGRLQEMLTGKPAKRQQGEGQGHEPQSGSGGGGGVSESFRQACTQRIQKAVEGNSILQMLGPGMVCGGVGGGAGGPRPHGVLTCMR